MPEEPATVFDVRPAVATDIPRLTAIDHSCKSDYVAVGSAARPEQ
jgi:hypothetical protein